MPSSSSSSAPNSRVRALRVWSTKDYALAAFIFLVLFSLLLLSHFDPSANPSHSTTTTLVPFTLLRHTRALCLDGSAPAYHFHKGFGSGSRNWLIHTEGGGWCNSISSCSQRKFTHLGSSKYMEKLIPFSGILSPDPSQNPDFFNWNKVKIRYCDGASFAGHPESERASGLFFRGQAIWDAIMNELLSIGLSTAKQALLSGCSAGGLATLIHCDNFRQLLPKEATVKCLADAGFFLDEMDISGNRTMGSFYHDVVQLQGLAESLHKDCITKMEPSKCLFPSEIVKNMKTPLFLVHPAYDFWQIRNILVPQGSDPEGHWQNCRLNIRNCNANMMDKLDRHGGASLTDGGDEGKEFAQQPLLFMSCCTYPQLLLPLEQTIAESVGDWYFDREVVKRIDCSSYSCNPTCHNLDFT
ncbi:hypothetical protein Fmac_011070 [Flemingia macrophylla]|uniref:Pectin acetylesterase n=1 Tax=Flemingia macrophylla TaxID=520843 RepID=A0ABD1MLE9_9FABA